MSTPTSTTPAVGTAMPDIDLVGPDGRTATLHGLRSGHRAVVYFLRAATCPVCVRHANALTGLASSGQLGDDVRLVLVAPGDATEAAVLAPRVPAAPDGVWASGAGHAAAGLGTFLSLQHSGTFAVETDGTVLHARTATLPPQSLSRRELLHALGVGARP